jgi:hypothetical protein
MFAVRLGVGENVGVTEYVLELDRVRLAVRLEVGVRLYVLLGVEVRDDVFVGL